MSWASRRAFAVFTVLALATCPAANSSRVSFGDAQELYRLARAGDPAAVPIALKWLGQAVLTPDENEHHNENFAALFVVREYRIEEAGPDLVAIYQNSAAPRSIKTDVANAAAAMPSASSRRFLEVLRSDAELDFRPRQHVLGALVSLGDEAARKELRETCREWMSTPVESEVEVGYVRWVIERLGDEKLISDLEAMRDVQTDGKKQTLLSDVIDRMKCNGLSRDELLKIVEESDYTKHAGGSRRWIDALSALTEVADLDVIPRLQELRPWKNVPADRNPTMLQNRKNMARDEAISKIRRLNWHKLAQPATKSG